MELFPQGDTMPFLRGLENEDDGVRDTCLCPDSDGDGVDDCTELLFGTDPGDMLSSLPDHDGDGIRDFDDTCPISEND